MKAWHITLYIFLTIALSALLCAFFPQEGISIGSYTLEFPSIAEVLTPAGSEDVQDPFDLLHSREDELAAIREAQAQSNAAYEKALRENPIAICFPGDDFTLFDDFFRACDSAKNQGIRIVHYGDSQIEEDRISNRLRDRMQEHFGGMGVGLLPVVQTVPKMTVSQSGPKEISRFMAFGGSKMSHKYGHYGPMAQSCYVNGTVKLEYTLHQSKDSLGDSHHTTRVLVLLGELKSPMTISVNGQERRIEKSSLYTPVAFRFEQPLSSAKIQLKGRGEVLGISFDAPTGIQVDNVPMRGCGGTIFTAIAQGQLQPFLVDEHVRLIILEYGGNVLPGIKREASLEYYKKQISKVLQLFHTMAPQASILFIGPSDMSTRIKGSMQTYPMMEPMVQMLKEVCAENGAAYWDLYTVMGGHNSMIKWVQATPALACKDYVHFTHAGADRVGDLLYESLMLNYEYYKKRSEVAL